MYGVKPEDPRVTAACMICDGEGIVDGGDRVNPFTSMAEAYMTHCQCTFDTEWQGVLRVAIEWGAVDELREFAKAADYDIEKTLDLWDAYETKCLQGA